MSEREPMQNDDECVKDEQVRKDIQVLSSRLYDLRERFMKIIHKMNHDSIGFADQISDEDDTTDEESNDEMSVSEEDSDSSNDGDEKSIQRSKIRLRIHNLSIENILKRKARHHEYIKHVVEYPKIMKYLLNDNPDCVNIPLRHLEPFIKDYVNKNPSGKIYDKINHQMQDIRRNFLKNHP